MSSFATFFTAPRQGLQGWTIAAVALADLLAKVTPLLLSNIPFHITQTWMTHVVTTWMTVSFLTFMMLVVFLILLGSRWPYLPVEPDTMVGCIYYVCDSFMLLEFE